MGIKEVIKALRNILLFVVIFLIMTNVVPCSYAYSVGGYHGSGWTVCGTFNIIFFGIGGGMTDGGYLFFGIANLAQYGILIFLGLLVVSYLLSRKILDLYGKYKK
jgi:hypothetical protein